MRRPDWDWWLISSRTSSDDEVTAPGAYLIPMYDEIGISYKELRVVLARKPPREGMLRRPIVIDGRTVGSWKRTVDPESGADRGNAVHRSELLRRIGPPGRG